jgi:hypothetical protein
MHRMGATFCFVQEYEERAQGRSSIPVGTDSGTTGIEFVRRLEVVWFKYH